MRILALAVTTALAAPALADQPITINFAAEVEGTPFTCAQAYEGFGATRSTVEVADFRLFVTNPRLIDTNCIVTAIALDQDGSRQVDNVTLLNFEDATGISPGCMSFLNHNDCVSVMSQLGLGFRDIAPDQQLFRTMR